MFCLLKINLFFSLNSSRVFINNSFFNNNLLYKPFYKLNYTYNSKFIFFKFKEFNKIFYKFSYLNKIKLNNLLNIVNLLFQKNKFFLFLDTEYSNILPLYNKVFGLNNILNNKNLFFLKKNTISLNNFNYFYSNFLNNFNINCLFVFDYSFYKNFFLFFTKLNLPVIGLVKSNNKNPYLDYYFFVNNNNINFIKNYTVNLLYILYYKNYNINAINKKFSFLKNLIKNN